MVVFRYTTSSHIKIVVKNIIIITRLGKIFVTRSFKFILSQGFVKMVQITIFFCQRQKSSLLTLAQRIIQINYFKYMCEI